MDDNIICQTFNYMEYIMRIKKSVLISAFVLSSLPIFSNASVVITNNTSLYATGYLNSSICSSSVGNSGTLNPKPGTLTIAQGVLDFWCSNRTCTMEVFLTKNCSGKSIATVSADAKHGVTNIVNHDEARAYLSGSGSAISLNSGSKSIWDYLNIF